MEFYCPSKLADEKNQGSKIFSDYLTKKQETKELRKLEPDLDIQDTRKEFIKAIRSYQFYRAKQYFDRICNYWGRPDLASAVLTREFQELTEKNPARSTLGIAVGLIQEAIAKKLASDVKDRLLRRSLFSFTERKRLDNNYKVKKIQKFYDI
ncbi:MAG: hypothetical protein QXP53_00060 [Candidatus Pacearchaeota archaeon]